MGGFFLVFNQILREGFTEFGKSMHGYLTNEYCTAESRTSSPVQFKETITYEHVQIKVVSMWRRASYAGGIIGRH
jgi:hypothetical protein